MSIMHKLAGNYVTLELKSSQIAKGFTVSYRVITPIKIVSFMHAFKEHVGIPWELRVSIPTAVFPYARFGEDELLEGIKARVMVGLPPDTVAVLRVAIRHPTVYISL